MTVQIKSRNFEKLWLTSYTPQIDMLRYLNLINKEKARNLSRYYDEFQSKIINKFEMKRNGKFSYRLFLEDMILKKLIKIDKSNPSLARVLITPYGQEFLNYISGRDYINSLPI